MLQKALFLGQIFEIEIFMDLCIFRSPDSENGGEKDEENEKDESKKNKRTKHQTKPKQTIQESDV